VCETQRQRGDVPNSGPTSPRSRPCTTLYVTVAREPSGIVWYLNGKETGAAYDGSDDLCGWGSARLCRRTSAGRRPMSGRFCRSGVGRLGFPGSARVDKCLAGCVDRVPERSEWPGKWLFFRQDLELFATCWSHLDLTIRVLRQPRTSSR
jgi:hypothetical protein